MALDRQEELVLLTFRWQRSAGTLGNDGFFITTLAGVMELLWSASGIKNRMRSFPLFPSCSLADSIAPKGDENSSSVVTKGSACSLTCSWKFELEHPVYIGVLVPKHRRFGILTNLSLS
jgi:hypothetical protein